MKKESFGIGILSLTAVVLFVANYFAAPPTAGAGTVIKDRDYQLVTAQLSSGGEGLYVLDNRSGNLNIYTYDPNARRLTLRATRPVAEIFAAQR